jgi:hypothetical protein
MCFEAPSGRLVRFHKGFMKKLRIGIIDIVSTGPTRALYARIMNASLASIMPQVIGVWCKEEGHEVTFVCYTGFEDLLTELPDDVDVVFIGAFTEAAHTAYALSNLFRGRGAITVIGGPHARCYPEDAARYFDYVLGYTDKGTLRDVLRDRSRTPARGRPPRGRTAAQNPPGGTRALAVHRPDAQESAPPQDGSHARQPGVPVHLRLLYRFHGALSTHGFRGAPRGSPVPADQVQTAPVVGWHDPNFGVRFDDYLDMIEDAVPPGSIDFVAESSLSLLSEPHLKRLKRNSFKGVLPGIESWFSLGDKSKTGALVGMAKVRQVSEHVNLILRYIPYIQTNFVLGLDTDEGPEPFELTKRFLDMTPGAFPAYSLLSAFGRAAPLNLDYQRSNRVLPFPFHFLNNNGAMNVKPANYSWRTFYDHIIDLTRYSFSTRAIFRRFLATEGVTARWMNLVRAVSTEGFGRARYHREIRDRLDTDPQFRPISSRRAACFPSSTKTSCARIWDR